MTRARTAAAGRPAGLAYRVEVADLHAHLYRVTFTIAQPAAQQHVQLPAWIPGSYLLREFAKNLQNLSARQSGRPVPVKQLTKARWRIDCAADAPLELQYEVYAFDNSVRTAWLDATRGFFNGTSLYLMAEGQLNQTHTVDLQPCAQTPHWKTVTGLTPVQVNKQGFGLYAADNYDMLADCPVEMGDFWSGEFEVCGIPHRFVVAGAPPSFDGEQLLKDTQAICEEEIRFWHPECYKNKSALRTPDKAKSPIPFKNYLFVLNAVHDGYGGLEHRNSTILICNRKDLPRLPRTTLAPASHKQPEGYTTLLGLISHEYFHTWNVKRLRPAEFAHFDYSQENYTELLWFFEGFTSYYDDLFLRRARLIDNAGYLKLLSKTINQVLQTPGRKVQTVAQASYDAWIKYYRPDENTANATVSYYTKGSLVALCLDLTLRREGKTSLDAVMRGLWKRCAAGPMTQDDLLAVLQELGGRSFARDLNHWVHSTKELPLADVLESHGIVLNREPDQIAQQLGLRVKENSGLFIQQVLRGSVAEKAGFAAGDEWLAVDCGDGPWRMQALDDLNLYTTRAKKISALISRDRRLMTLTLAMPKPSHTLRLSVRDTPATNQWLEDTTP